MHVRIMGMYLLGAGHICNQHRRNQLCMQIILLKNQAVVECVTHRLISKLVCYKYRLLMPFNFDLNIRTRMSHK